MFFFRDTDGGTVFVLVPTGAPALASSGTLRAHPENTARRLG